MRRERFDVNRVRQLGAQTEPDVADLADHVVVLEQTFDPLFLTEAHLSQALTQIRGSGELFDPHRRPGTHLAERAGGAEVGFAEVAR